VDAAAGREPLHESHSLFIFTKRPGRRTNVRFMPGCLVFSLVASIVLTVLLNLLIRAF
jgi:hypothetical protein